MPYTWYLSTPSSDTASLTYYLFIENASAVNGTGGGSVEQPVCAALGRSRFLRTMRRRRTRLRRRFSNLRAFSRERTALYLTPRAKFVHEEGGSESVALTGEGMPAQVRANFLTVGDFAQNVFRTERR